MNTHNLEIAKKAKKLVEKRLNMEGCRLPVKFKEMNAYKLEFPDNSVDIIIVNNVFENFMEPKVVMDECYRILKFGGYLLVPNLIQYTVNMARTLSMDLVYHEPIA